MARACKNRGMRILAAALLLLVGLVFSAIGAEEVDVGRMRALAEKGDAKAQYLLGECLQHGRSGAVKDEAEAVRW